MPTGTPAGVAPFDPPRTWGRPPWFPLWQAEHVAVREGVMLMDMAFMAKFEVTGRATPDACWTACRPTRVDGTDATITYTQWLDDAADPGRPHGDEAGRRPLLVVASDTAHRHVETLMRRHFGQLHAFVTDVTSGLAQLNVQGPRSRELLQTVTSVELSNEAFPFRTAREIDLGFARVMCIRITYVGELGYELHIPAEQAVHVYDRLVEAGADFDLRHAGLKALGQPAHGEGLPGLRARHRQHRRRRSRPGSGSSSTWTSPVVSSVARP